MKAKSATIVELTGGGAVAADANGKLFIDSSSVSSVTAGAGLVNSGTAADPVIDAVSGGATLTITADNMEVAAAIVSGAAAGATAVQPVRQVIAGAGMTGGGNLSADVTLNVIAGDATITVAADSVVVGAINTANINADQVTYAKIQNVTATDRLLGRDTAAAGDIEEITVGGGLVFTGTLGIQTTAFTGDVTKTLGGTAQTIANGVVDNNKLASMAAQTIKGNNTGAPSQPSDMSIATVLGMLGTFATLNVQVFTATGANTYTPVSGMKWCLAISTGAGGGGGGADMTTAAPANVSVGGGGGAGGTCWEFFSAGAIGASQTVTIGTGGTAGSGTNGTNGGNGGNTTFGALHTANGGTGGTGGGVTDQAAKTSAGGAAGVPTGGTANITGGAGFAGSASAITGHGHVDGGYGGGSVWGTGGDGGHIAQATLAAASATGLNAAAFGAGAGGGAVIDQTVGAAGGVGANGICVVIEFA